MQSGLARYHVTRQRCSVAPAPKSEAHDVMSVIIIIIIINHPLFL